jgi:hypothetical protein
VDSFKSAKLILNDQLVSCKLIANRCHPNDLEIDPETWVFCIQSSKFFDSWLRYSLVNSSNAGISLSATITARSPEDRRITTGRKFGLDDQFAIHSIPVESSKLVEERKMSTEGSDEEERC